MLSLEIRLLSNGRDVSLEELADRVAAKVLGQILPTLGKQTHRPSESSLEPRVVGVKRATELLSLSRSTIWKLVKEGRLDTVRLGRRTMLRMESILKVVEKGIPS